jgi:hypothetical protein
VGRRSIALQPGSRDGTSQRSRRLAALDPAYAPVDERTHADMVRFVQAYAEQLRFLEGDDETGGLRSTGTWTDFVRRADVSIADIVAYLADPSRFTGDKARWLGRPHFALLLTFLELLGHARDHLNGFTRRHLDYYYRDVLQLGPEPPAPDRATVLFGLRAGAPRVIDPRGPASEPGTSEVRLPAGTELRAGRDASGVPRIYRTEREIVVNRAQVAQVRSVFVDRRITGISDVRADRSLTAAGALTETLKMALGSPYPGDAIKPWSPKTLPASVAVDTAFLRSLVDPLDFTRTSLYLEHNELRSLMRLVRRRRAADAEWAEINRLLGVTNPANPRDFAANLKARVGDLDLAHSGLPLVKTVDDLYTYRTEPAVRAFIDSHFGASVPPITFQNFVDLMQIKLRIDAEWAEINRLLERAGRRKRGVLAWSFLSDNPTSFDPTNFDANLVTALSWTPPPPLPSPWPPSWPLGTHGIDDYDALLRGLEAHLAMSVERIQTLASFAKGLGDNAASEDYDWSDVDRILADAYREKLRAARQDKLVDIRAGLDTNSFDRVANFVLGEATPITWDLARPRLAAHLDPSQIDLLTRFRAALADPHQLLFGFGWSDADRLFELAWRHAQGLPEPIAQKIEVHNVYAYDDAKQAKDAAALGWKTFGRTPEDADEQHPRGATLGWALRSPLLSLSEGTRTLTLTLGLRRDGFGQLEQAAFLTALGLTATDRAGAKLVGALQSALVLEVSTAKGWIALGLNMARLASGAAGDDYWSVRGVPRARDENRPALQLQAIIDKTVDPLAPRKGENQIWPALRLSLRPRWDDAAKEWRTAMEAFAPLVLTAVHLKVEVDGLTALHLQQDDRQLDPRKPFEPFGSRPAVGARLYIEHPELVRARLDRLRFDIEWMGLPAVALKDYYVNYPGLTTTSEVFKTRVALVDRNIEVALGDLSLFDDSNNKGQPMHSLRIDDVPAALRGASPTFVYGSRTDLASLGDLRLASRHLRWELTPVDFGHGISASLTAAKARELAIDIASGTAKADTQHPAATVAAPYRVESPYTPTIKRLSVFYSTAVELDPTTPVTEHQLLHVHPFGVCPIDAQVPSLVPRYDTAGELYIGVRDLKPPQHLTLLLQLAEGTSNPDIERAPVTWSYLAANGFADLSGTGIAAGAGIVDDATRGLINAGIVELALPAAVSDGRLPPDLYWLRLAIPRNPTSVCDVVAIRAQAVSVRFDDRGNAPAHYEQPLPAGSINRLLDPDARISRVEQPYSSFDGRPAEKPALFDTRVSERLHHKMRALSAWDYERLVLHRFRQIYKAKCLSNDGAVDVIVIPDIRELHPADPLAPKAPANLLADIQAYLAERAPAAARVRVRNAHYVPVQVRIGVRFRSGVDEGFAQRQLSDDLIRFVSPWAFDDGAELTIGGRIYANSILDFVDRRDYVDFVAEIELSRSLDGKHFDLVAPVDRDGTTEHYVPTDRPDQVLVAAQQHYFDVIPDTGYQQASFIGINYARIELDFIVG